jgi:membrane protein
VNFLVSLGVVAGLFALILRFVPDVRLPWRDIWLGAGLTAVLFTLGKTAIGMYLGKAGVGSAYGAAGSLVVLVVWIYYSAQIFFYGATFTQVYAQAHGRLSKPMAEQSQETANPPLVNTIIPVKSSSTAAHPQQSLSHQSQSIFGLLFAAGLVIVTLLLRKGGEQTRRPK